MLWNNSSRQLKLIRIISPHTSGELSTELNNLIENLPTEMSSRINISTINAIDPIAEIGKISHQVDLTITGIGHTWSRKKPILDSYADRLAVHCASSLLLVRRYCTLTNYLSIYSLPTRAIFYEGDKLDNSGRYM